MINEQTKVTRCGFCGRYFDDSGYIADADAHIDAPLGYCPEAQYEQDGDDNTPRYVTKDMATDAGYPEMEGTRL